MNLFNESCLFFFEKGWASMKKLLTGVIVFALAAAVGCESKSPPAGPGAKAPTGGAATTDRGTGTTVRGQSDDKNNTFKLVKPGTVELKQAEAKTFDVKIDRSKDFTQPVTIT